MKFYRCNICGNLMFVINDADVIPMCCGQQMEELKPLSNDEPGKEKHVPIIDIKDNVVRIEVSDKPHPMSKEHYIVWIALETDKGAYLRYLDYDQQPYAQFSLVDDEKVIRGYCYCNIHSLWEGKYEE